MRMFHFLVFSHIDRRLSFLKIFLVFGSGCVCLISVHVCKHGNMRNISKVQITSFPWINKNYPRRLIRHDNYEMSRDVRILTSNRCSNKCRQPLTHGNQTER